MTGGVDPTRSDSFRRELAQRGFTFVSADPPDGACRRVQVQVMQPVAAPSGATLYVPLPVEIAVTLGADGKVLEVEGGRPTPDAIAAAGDFVRVLLANHQLAPAGAPPPAGATHQIEIDPDGRQVVRRRRFSAA